MHLHVGPIHKYTYACFTFPKMKRALRLEQLFAV